MAATALAALVVFGLCISARGWVHARRTGESPLRAGAANGKFAVVGYGVLFTVPPLLDAAGVLPRLATGAWLGVSGVVIVTAGCVGTLLSAAAMGDSWRIGVDDTERTELVTTGIYRFVRNPIYTAMVVFAVGVALLTPNIAAIVAVGVVVAVLEVVVRSVEEPYLARQHDLKYADWAARTGRFFPRFGMLHRASSDRPRESSQGAKSSAESASNHLL